MDDHHASIETEVMALSGFPCRLAIPDGFRCVARRQQPLQPLLAPAQTRFCGTYLTLARTASRLQWDFDLGDKGLPLQLRLLNRIHNLEMELSQLRAQGPHVTS
jgi:hypothetical protein